MARPITRCLPFCRRSNGRHRNARTLAKLWLTMFGDCTHDWTAFYVQGTLTDGKKFDSSLVRFARPRHHAPCAHGATCWPERAFSSLCASQDRDEPFSFTLGQGQVIKVLLHWTDWPNGISRLLSVSGQDCQQSGSTLASPQC